MSVDFSRKKILIIDDFAEFRHSIKRMFESFGAKDIDNVGSGDEAINHMSKKAYDMIICDYNLGYNKKDGQQVLEEAKHRKLMMYSTIFIMVTAENTRSMVMGALEYQPDDYLVKPITKEILKNRLEKLIKRKDDFEGIEKAINNREYLQAIELCDSQIRNNQKNILEYMKLKADLLLSIGNYEEATTVFEQVLAMRNIPWAKLGLGKVSFLSGNFLQAKEIFQSIIDENRIFMEAYDWLGKTLMELESLQQAQQVLMAAAEISPKCILRQKTVGEIAHKNGDYDTAEKSLKAAIRLGKNSCFKDPSHYTSLARVLTDKKSPDEALTVLNQVRSEFRDNPKAIFQASVIEGTVYKELNRPEEAKQALEAAIKLFANPGGTFTPETGMELARSCFELREKETGKKLMQDIIRNHHEDATILKKVEEVFNDVQLQEEGADIIASTRREIIQINKRGVQLVEEGKLEEAIAYFEKAADGLPENKIINANAAKTILMSIEKNGKDDRSLARAGKFLERIDSSDKNHQKIWKMYEQITKP